MNRIRSINRVIFFLAACCFSSCDPVVDERLEISIQNRTDSSIQIILYPKDAIGSSYPICKRCEEHKNTEFTLSPYEDDQYYHWEDAIFYTTDLNMKPNILTSEAFDSIFISTENIDNTIIKFTPDKVTGYSENIFTDDTSWALSIIETEQPDRNKRHSQKYYRYSFVIAEDKIKIE